MSTFTVCCYKSLPFSGERSMAQLLQSIKVITLLANWALICYNNTQYCQGKQRMSLIGLKRYVYRVLPGALKVNQDD